MKPRIRNEVMVRRQTLISISASARGITGQPVGTADPTLAMKSPTVFGWASRPGIMFLLFRSILSFLTFYRKGLAFPSKMKESVFQLVLSCVRPAERERVPHLAVSSFDRERQMSSASHLEESSENPTFVGFKARRWNYHDMLSCQDNARSEEEYSFLGVRQLTATIQCVLMVTEKLVSTQMVKYATYLSRELIVDIEGEATERLEALYPTLKELALAGSPDRGEIEREGSSCMQRPQSTEQKQEKSSARPPDDEFYSGFSEALLNRFQASIVSSCYGLIVLAYPAARVCVWALDYGKRFGELFFLSN
ncbi:hypothetical protein M5K25_005100 [Dendrobium thyrsiflorum]|uniref:Uncharacterized protein n=1 Tax=Dendrobium thyrsiflorum TaxID=117978 RepID=A0ABD0VGT3_DENTH